MNTITWSVLQMDSHLATECSHTRYSCGDMVSRTADIAGVCVCVCVCVCACVGACVRA